MDSIVSFCQKYNKYCKLNFKDLKGLKIGCFKRGNYQQTKHFIEYERYLEDSYFMNLVNFFRNTVMTLLDNFHESEWIDSFFINKNGQFKIDLDKHATQINRT
jgi:hypothetical protein